MPMAERESVRAPEPVESRGTTQGEVGETGQYLLGVVERMGLGDFTIAEAREGDVVIYQLSGAAALELGGGDGRAVDALQLLANQAEMSRNEEPRKIVVDAEVDPERRESFLTRLAERAARRAQESRRSVALDPMNGKDRRAIHVALREMEGVATMSIGSGRYRQVVVVPEGAPEYEEARRVSEASASSEPGE
jgi:spoIIIJ-associated protein